MRSTQAKTDALVPPLTPATEPDERPGIQANRMFPVHFLLPKQVRRRLKALKSLQLKTLKLQAKFFEDLHKLHCRYGPVRNELANKRAGIVAGTYDPTDEECQWPEPLDELAEADEVPAVRELRAKLSITRELEAGARGVPEFWLTVLKNGELTQDLIYPHDEPILRHLKDLRVQLRENDPMTFCLQFYFSQNPYFTNKMLTKEYVMRCEVDEETPWAFDGPRIVRAKGTEIEWTKGMDVTKTTVRKKQRHKSGTVGTLTKTIKNDSFFNFFEHQRGSGSTGSGEEGSEAAELDYQVGVFLREKLIPQAVIYFTGEALDDESSSDEDEESTDQSEQT